MSSLSSESSHSYGALLIGGLMAFIFSGVVCVQCIIYIKLYPEDSWRTKLMVYLVWFLDLVHSSFIAVALVFYFVTFFGNELTINHIHWSIALSVEVTAVQIFITHWFFARKIYRSSNRNYLLITPIAILAFTRLIVATITTSEMLKLGRYSAFNQKYPGWIFTMTLSLSVVVDLIITCCLFYHLRTMRRQLGTTGLVQVIDTLTLYTLENGLLTCIVATASLICWRTMPSNLVFLGLHFLIGKLYANSLLASLNTRKELRQMGPRIISPWTDTSLATLPFDNFSVPLSPRSPFALLHGHGINLSSPPRSPRNNKMPGRVPQTLEVNVQQIIERTSKDGERDGSI